MNSRIIVYDLEYNMNRLPCLVKCGEYAGVWKVEKPEDAYKIFEKVFCPGLKTEEYVYLMCCDSAGYIVGMFVVSQGTVVSALQNIRGIMLRALLCNASGIIVAHNHPSGECKISKEDEGCFQKLKEICGMMEVALLDNLILGCGNYLSFKEERLL